MDKASLVVEIITLFPGITNGPLDESIIKRARENGLVDIRVHNLRDYTHDKHKTADDRPYGGGPGMVLKPEPIFECIEKLRRDDSRVIFVSPQGKLFGQKRAAELSKEKHLIILCGHYEGVDERVRERLIDEEISIGDYVLTNGTLAAMVIIDAVVRLIPGVLGDAESSIYESFAEGFLDYPHYTRPEEFRDMEVPDVLRSGNHLEIEKWRRKEALKRTLRVRPDLMDEKGAQEDGNQQDDHKPGTSSGSP